MPSIVPMPAGGWLRAVRGILTPALGYRRSYAIPGLPAVNRIIQPARTTHSRRRPPIVVVIKQATQKRVSLHGVISTSVKLVY